MRTALRCGCGHAEVETGDLASLMASAREAALVKKLAANFMVAKIDDPKLRRSSSATTYMMQQLGLVRLARDAVVTFQQRNAAQ